MSSTSVARQNRRIRLKNFNDHQKEPKLIHLTASELKCNDNATNSDKDIINVHNDDQSSNQGNSKLVYSPETESYETLSFTNSSILSSHEVSSCPIEKVFIEAERGFKEINAHDIFQISHRKMPYATGDESELLINLAFETAKYFHSFSNLCHGLLGGLSFLYILVLLHLFADLLVNENTVKFFSFFSKPIHNIFNLLCVICCVSVFDRFDITNTGEIFKSIRKLDFRLVILLIYPLSLLLSLSTANVDEKLSMPGQNSTIWESLNYKETTELYYWKTLSLAKCFGALLGWIVICWNQNFNQFFELMKVILLRRKMPVP